MLEIITGENIEKLRELAHKDSVNECVEWLTEHYYMVGEEVVKLQDENKKLMELEDRKREFIDIKRREVAGLKIENKELKAKIETLENENGALHNTTKLNMNVAAQNEYKIGELEKENEELKKELDKSYIKINGAGFEKTKLENKYIESVERNAALTKENEELKESLRTIQAMDKEDPDSRIEELLNTVRDLENQKTGLWDDIKLRNERIKKLEYEVHDKNLTIGKMQSNINYERGQNVQAKETIDKLIEALK